MAMRIQSAWRVKRAKYLADMARALKALREKQFKAARQIQRIVRGRFGRLRASRYKLLMEELARREKAALKLCRIFRGHKGRERFEVAFQDQRLATMARPLFAREAALLVEKQGIETAVAKAQAQLDATLADATSLREELETMLTITAKY